MLATLCPCAVAAQTGKIVEHVIVYKEPGRFGGWPANHGIWSWGDEILVGFTVGYYKYQGPTRHAIDNGKPQEPMLARSLDGGKTWRLEKPVVRNPQVPEGEVSAAILPRGFLEMAAVDCPGGIEFTHPDFAMTVRMSSIHTGPSRFFYSTDRGKTWSGPFKLPMFDTLGIAARTDYIVNGKHDCMLFLTAAKSNGREGRPLCVRTVDGGKTWQFVAWIGPEPKGFSIMPSTVRLSETSILTALRHHEGRKRWIETYLSEDNGETWRFLNIPVPSTGEGNPPSMIKLKDGRICITYGYRAKPFSMCARLSNDNGRSWGDEIALRNDGGCRDMGYPRTVQRTDGKIVTVYYFNEGSHEDRYIAATIWDPGVAAK